MVSVMKRPSTADNFSAFTMADNKENEDAMELEVVDPEFEEIIARVQVLEEKSKIILQQNSKIQQTFYPVPYQSSSIPSGPCHTISGSRTVLIQNVHYDATGKELKWLVRDCGIVRKITLPRNRYSGRTKGFAYIEFVNSRAANSALFLNGSYLRGRKIQVSKKRTIPHIRTAYRASNVRPSGLYRWINPRLKQRMQY